MTAESTVETLVNDDLIAGSTPPIATDTGTLITGQNLVRGAVLGRITASGKFILCDTGAIDGSEAPVAILVHDIDATAGDLTCQVYQGGAFHKDEMTWDASFTTDVQKEAAFDGSMIVIR
jgi:hypothetical protein